MTQPNSNSNLFCALRAAFPGDLDQIAVETTSPQGEPLLYTWRDLDHASARIANLLASLKGTSKNPLSRTDHLKPPCCQPCPSHEAP